MGRGVRKCGKDDRGPHGKAIRRDQSYKSMFSHPRVVEDLVRGFDAELFEGGEEWVERLDFSTPGPLPTERIDSNLRGRSNDLVWPVRFRDAEDGLEWLHVVLILEFQSSVDWGTALRMQGYAVRLFEGLWPGAARGPRRPAAGGAGGRGLQR
ncbi:MAG: Rpn family recombination-promoting nuclease/putative transposase [Bryobacterales bacterium]|nr:Rpn family recombination-promoting nuclease/putative transposase [Bryobacterales bacterium]